MLPMVTQQGSGRDANLHWFFLCTMLPSTRVTFSDVITLQLPGEHNSYEKLLRLPSFLIAP